MSIWQTPQGQKHVAVIPAWSWEWLWPQHWYVHKSLYYNHSATDQMWPAVTPHPLPPAYARLTTFLLQPGACHVFKYEQCQAKKPMWQNKLVSSIAFPENWSGPGRTFPVSSLAFSPSMQVSIKIFYLFYHIIGILFLPDFETFVAFLEWSGLFLL